MAQKAPIGPYAPTPLRTMSAKAIESECGIDGNGQQDTATSEEHGPGGVETALMHSCPNGGR